jgi:hypothetical protein
VADKHHLPLRSLSSKADQTRISMDVGDDGRQWVCGRSRAAMCGSVAALVGSDVGSSGSTHERLRCGTVGQRCGGWSASRRRGAGGNLGGQVASTAPLPPTSLCCSPTVAGILVAGASGDVQLGMAEAECRWQGAGGSLGCQAASTAPPTLPLSSLVVVKSMASTTNPRLP